MKRNDAPVVVKIGGSVITDKRKPFSVDHQAISRIAKAVSDSGQRLVLVHGGGSFGHPLAHKYRLHEGFKREDQLFGLVKTHQAMLALNRAVVDGLQAENVAALSLPPMSLYVTKRGRITGSFTEPLKLIMRIGGVPVCFGDMVADTVQGFCVLSGDQIAVHLALSLGAERLVFAMNVDGVLEADPREHRRASLLPRLDLRRLRQLISEWTTTVSREDVTSGIVGKLSECIPAVEAGIRIRLVNGLDGRILRSALEGRRCRGTSIVR